MGVRKFILLGALILARSGSFAQQRIVVHVPSAEEEAMYIWSNLRDIQFFEEHNYQVSFPDGKLMKELMQKSRLNQLQEEDYELLEKLMQDSVYRKQDYEEGYQKIQEQLPLLNRMVDSLSQMSLDWDFLEFESYRVELTLYGPGGSYYPERGALLVYTTPQGGFKQYLNPANTIIHEIVHIGIQASIIDRFQVPHSLKERIVDTFVYLSFSDLLPEYRIQDMGDYRLDQYVQGKDDLQKLAELVARIMKA